MSSIFKIYSPEDCDFYYDGELQGHIEGNSKKSFRFEVERKGVYRLEFINSEYQTELMMKVSIDVDEEREVELDFSEVNEPAIRQRERIISAIEHDYRERKRLSEEIISAISNNGCIIIPKGVRKIGASAFHNSLDPTYITIPDSVTKIGEMAFQSCLGLTSISIPNSVIEIGAMAFRNCLNLTSVTIPDSVIEIGESAFSRCNSLTAFFGKYASNDNRCLIKNGKLLAFAPYDITKYTIPNSVTKIGCFTFYNCSMLSSIIIPDSVTEIGIGAFWRCRHLTTFYSKYASNDNRCLIKNGKLLAFAPYDITKYAISNSVVKIEDHTFSGCDSLTSITIPNSVTEIGEMAFAGCFHLTAITISDGVTKIGEMAFQSCHDLTSITIPNSVIEIGDGAFRDCSRLRSVYCKAANPPKIGEFHLSPRFEYNASDPKIYVPKSEGSTVLEAYKSAEVWKDYADNIEEYDFDNE